MMSKVLIQKISFSNYDSATYLCTKNKLIIQANTINAASYALYDYVKKFCKSSLSHTGDNITIPQILPDTRSKATIAARYPLRYALNYCTYSYTMSFWKWEDWEKELDWMSLNGVNLMLAPMGTEAVWQKTMLELGFKDKEIRDFIPGPAFNAWWLMGNLEGWGGPVSDNMISHWAVLQKKIIARMKELKISPVVQGFTGLVPSTITKYYPTAQLVDQGNWCGFKRPVVLLPKDELFNKIAGIYYKNLKELYGSDFSYIGGDLFHEGGETKGVNLTETAHLLQKNMQEHFPNCTWVLQGWQHNPQKIILDGLDPKHTLILDLMGDDAENWLKRNQYGNFPWIWTTITNFGGKTTSSGNLLRAYTETHLAEKHFGQNLLLKGTGIIPEGIENNAIIYQWALDRSWQKNIPDVQDKLTEFIIARYGTINEDLKAAWQYLLQTTYSAYHPDIPGGQGGYESIFCSRPDTNYIYSTSCCGPKRLWYDPAVLLQAALSFEKAFNRIKNVETLNFDLTDTWRQVINLKGRTVYEELVEAIKRNDKNLFETKKKEFIQLIELQDRWLGTNPYFRVGRWLTQAKDLLPHVADKKNAEWNARTQITYWGTATDPNNLLHDYAQKEWQGLLKDLYLPRWNLFFEYATAKINGGIIKYPNFFEMEKNWSRLQNDYKANPEGNIEALLKEIHQIVINAR